MKIRISLLAAVLALLDGCAVPAAITVSSLPEPALRADLPAAIAYGKGIYVKVDERGRLLTSKEGIRWLVRDVGFKTFLRKVIYANGLFVAAGGSYIDEPAVVLTSENGTRWTRRKIPIKANLYDVT